MPNINLKPNSPEFADDKRSSRPIRRTCDMPECAECGEYKAPKDRGLSDYYWFCLSHIQEYNKAWDFFSGMSSADIEHHINSSTVWDRPTRRYDSMASMADSLKRKAYQTYHFTDEPPPEDRFERKQNGFSEGFSRQTPEFEALAIMGLCPPITLEEIKESYKTLVKKHHPDHADPAEARASEELLKKINMAYTILKMAYSKYDTLVK